MKQLSYWEFLMEIEKLLKAATDKKVRIQKVIKNNGIKLDAIWLSREEEPITPTIYLNGYYESYQKGESLESIRKKILALSEQKPKGAFDTEQFLDYTKAKDRILFKLIHAKRNEAWLDEVPHRLFLDLAVVFYYLVPEEEVNASVLIRMEHLQLWDVTEEELYLTAMQNTPRVLEPEIQDMNAVVAEMFTELPEQNEDFPEETSPMYVATNKKKFYGAACMLYPGLLKTFAEMKDSDFYILPSSVHEILLVPVELGEQEALSEMVREVNETQVLAEEILSDHAYLYQRLNDQIRSV